jgi:hypothetical protein
MKFLSAMLLASAALLAAGTSQAGEQPYEVPTDLQLMSPSQLRAEITKLLQRDEASATASTRDRCHDDECQPQVSCGSGCSSCGANGSGTTTCTAVNCNGTTSSFEQTCSCSSSDNGGGVIGGGGHGGACQPVISCGNGCTSCGANGTGSTTCTAVHCDGTTSSFEQSCRC